MGVSTAKDELDVSTLIHGELASLFWGELMLSYVLIFSLLFLQLLFPSRFLIVTVLAVTVMSSIVYQSSISLGVRCCTWDSKLIVN